MKEKPYKELKDSDGRPDDEVSREAWDYHLSRNESVIVDLFQGQVGHHGNTLQTLFEATIDFLEQKPQNRCSQ